MRKRIPLYAVIVTVLFTAALAFSVAFFPLRYIRAEEQTRQAENELELKQRLEALQRELAACAPDGRYDAERLRQMLDYLVKNSIYDLPDAERLTEGLIEGALDAMGDRHGTYYNPAEYAEHQSDTAGNLYGIGITVTRSDEGYIRVLLVHRGSPADGKIAAGDLISAVDGHKVLEVGYDEARTRLSGEAGTAVSLTVLRGGEELTLTDIVRGSYVSQTVVSKTIVRGETRLGYVHLTGFDRKTYAQFTEAVSAHEASGVGGLIFDMRNNPGGLLWEVCRVLAYVLPDGDIVHVDYASEERTDYKVSAKDGYLEVTNDTPELYAEGGHEITLPIVVLVNQNTASAAELFTAAIRDYAADGKMNAAVVGVETYGKGTVQTSNTGVTGEAGAALKISVAHYMPPSGESYDGFGIAPSHRSELPAALANMYVLGLTEENDLQLQRAIAELTK